MNGMKVELVFFAGCPHVEAAREAIRAALVAAGLPPRWREWNRDDSATPGHLRDYGSPTVLVNGRDIAPVPADANCCRLYAGENGPRGAPAAEAIRAALEADLLDDESK